MAGNKNSGRKSNANEEFRLATIEKCWKLVNEAIDDESLDYEYRVELASRHTVKSIPTELAGGITANLTAMGTIVYGGVEAKFNIGTPDNTSEDTKPSA